MPDQSVVGQALAEAHAALQGDSNDAEHDALYGLVSALAIEGHDDEHYELSDRQLATILSALQSERDRLIDAGHTGRDCQDALNALYRGMTPDTHGLTYRLNNP